MGKNSTLVICFYLRADKKHMPTEIVCRNVWLCFPFQWKWYCTERTTGQMQLYFFFLSERFDSISTYLNNSDRSDKRWDIHAGLVGSQATSSGFDVSAFVGGIVNGFTNGFGESDNLLAIKRKTTSNEIAIHIRCSAWKSNFMRKMTI